MKRITVIAVLCIALCLVSCAVPGGTTVEPTGAEYSGYEELLTDFYDPDFPQYVDIELSGLELTVENAEGERVFFEKGDSGAYYLCGDMDAYAYKQNRAEGGKNSDILSIEPSERYTVTGFTSGSEFSLTDRRAPDSEELSLSGETGVYTLTKAVIEPDKVTLYGDADPSLYGIEHGGRAVEYVIEPQEDTVTHDPAVAELYLRMRTDCVISNARGQSLTVTDGEAVGDMEIISQSTDEDGRLTLFVHADEYFEYESKSGGSGLTLKQGEGTEVRIGGRTGGKFRISADSVTVIGCKKDYGGRLLTEDGKYLSLWFPADDSVSEVTATAAGITVRGTDSSEAYGDEYMGLAVDYE